MSQPRRVCRVLIDPEPNDGARNMAIDEALLIIALDEGECFVRIYEWSTATVSLGYFQDYDAFMKSPELSTLPVVRRLSGGGAIVHDHEITYSCAIPADHPLATNPHSLYEIVHQSFIAELDKLGFATELRGVSCDIPDQPLLCFCRRDRCDILMKGQKVMGSAQRRRRGAVLQHGSLLIKKSVHTPELRGICDHTESGRIDHQFSIRIAQRIGLQIATNTEYETLPGQLAQLATELERTRYRHPVWDSQLKHKKVDIRDQPC